MGKSFSIPLIYKDASDNNALKLDTGKSVSLREDPYTADLYVLTETTPGVSGVYKHDNVEDKIVRLYINGSYKSEYGTFRTYGDLSGMLEPFFRKDGTLAMTGEFNGGGFRMHHIGNPVSGIDVGDRDYNDSRYLQLSEVQNYWYLLGKRLIVDADLPGNETGKKYQTIQGAINYAQSQTPNASNQWLIIIFPKKDTAGYAENITLQPYVHLAGSFGMPVKIYGTMNGMNINTRLYNINWFSLGNFTVSGIRAKDCSFITDDPESTGFDITVTGTVTRNCYFHASQNVISGGNNTYKDLATSAGFDPQSTDKGNHYSYNLPNFTGFILDI